MSFICLHKYQFYRVSIYHYLNSSILVKIISKYRHYLYITIKLLKTLFNRKCRQFVIFKIYPRTYTIEIFILKLGYGKHTEVINLQSITAFTSDALSENKQS